MKKIDKFGPMWPKVHLLSWTSVLFLALFNAPQAAGLELRGARRQQGGGAADAALWSSSNEGTRPRDVIDGLRSKVEKFRGHDNDDKKKGGGISTHADVTVEDVEHEHYKGKRWGIQDSEGGSDKTEVWRKTKGGGTVAWYGAVAFVTLVGSLPIILAWSYKYVTKTQIFESIILYIWLSGGLYLFREVIIFQSPHFQEPRTLSLEEAVYLFAQILTTVGYGDVTPARPRGQVFIGLFVIMSVLLISNMITELLEFFQSTIEHRLNLNDDEKDEKHRMTDKQRLKHAFEPVIYTSLVFLCFVFIGYAFFVYWPGENKSPHQAVYMSLITLSTVGFGAFTPTTHAGMVFGAFWMLFGSTSLVSVITSRAAFSLALKNYEIKTMDASSSAGKDTGSAPAMTKKEETKRLQKEQRAALRQKPGS
jgi:cbb3-type cytochrome oxidase subunit 3